MTGPTRWLVATDIDGTIVPHHGTVTSRTRDALHAVVDAGLELVLVTGRPPRWLPPVIEATGLETTAICANGAIVIDTSSHEVLDIATIAREEALEIVQLMRAAMPDLVFAAESPGVMRAGPGYEVMRRGGRMTEGLIPVDHKILTADSYEEMLSEQVFKMVAFAPESTPDALLALAREHISDLAAVTHSSTSRAFIEIGPKGVTKDSTLARFAQARNFHSSQVIAFGDMPNDVGMLTWAGRGYAMAGAHPEAIAAAPLLAPPASEDGVAQVLEELLSALRASD